MNIAPNPLPATVLTAEAPRPAQPPSHESSRPVIAPNPSGPIAEETRRDDEPRTGQHTERKLEHEPQSHSQHTRRRTASVSATVDSPAAAEPRPHNLAVGGLLDVFA